MTIPRTAADIQAWVAKAKPGDRTIYHVGNMGAERERSRRLQKPHPFAGMFDEVLKNVDRGYVSVTQKVRASPKGQDRVFEYWMERRHRKPDHANSILFNGRGTGK